MGFNWLDTVIVIVKIAALLRGISVGLIGSVFTVLSIAAGITCAARYYAAASTWLLQQITLPTALADLVSFAVIFLIAAAVVQFVAALFASITRLRIIRLADRIGGAAAGLLIGIAVTGLILVLLTSFPLMAGLQDQVGQSALAPTLIDTGHTVYGKAMDLLPVDLPSLAFYPEQLTDYFQQTGQPELRRIDFKQLDGAACFVCGDSVGFLGYMTNRYGSVSPKFQCTGCGRTSDGCQTFEGHHLMYEECPVVLGRRGYRFDCGIWSNLNYHRPTGTCPVCGESS